MPLPQGRVTDDATNYFAIGLQSAKDVDATVFYFLKHLDGTGFDVNVESSSERIGGSGREIGLRYRTKVTADGQYIAYAQPDFLGRVLTAALWQDTTTAGPSQGVGNPYYSTHAINSGASVPLYQTIEQNWADETERVANNVISDLKLEGEAGRPVKVTVQFVTGGTPHFNSTQLSATREAAFPFMVPGGSVAILAGGSSTGQPQFGGGLGYGIGASSLQLTKWSLEIKNAVDDAIQTVALNREDVLVLTQDFDVTGTFKYINNAMWNTIWYGQGSTVPTGLLENGQFFFNTTNPSSMSCTVFAPFVEFTALKVNRLDPDGKTMYVDFTASTRNIGSQALQCTVISAASTAYSLSTT